MTWEGCLTCHTILTEFDEVSCNCDLTGAPKRRVLLALARLATEGKEGRDTSSAPLKPSHPTEEKA